MKKIIIILILLFTNIICLAQFEKENALSKIDLMGFKENTNINLSYSNSWGSNLLNLYSKGRTQKKINTNFYKRINQNLFIKSLLNFTDDFRREVKSTLLYKPLFFNPFNISDNSTGNISFQGPELETFIIIKNFLNLNLYVNYTIVKGNKDDFSFSENTFRRYGFGFKQSIKLFEYAKFDYGALYLDNQNTISAKDINNRQIDNQIFLSDGLNIKRIDSQINYKNTAKSFSPMLSLIVARNKDKYQLSYFYKTEQSKQFVPFESFLEKEITLRKTAEHLFQFLYRKKLEESNIIANFNYYNVIANDYYSLYRSRLTNYNNKIFESKLCYKNNIEIALGLTYFEGKTNLYVKHERLNNKFTKFYGKLFINEYRIKNLKLKAGIELNKKSYRYNLLNNDVFLNDISLAFNYLSDYFNNLIFQINYSFKTFNNNSNFNSFVIIINYNLN